MGRHSGDTTMVSSSIALLQERFRQLERVREKREEKELLKLFGEPDQVAPAMSCESNKLSFQPEMILPHRPSFQDCSLSLGLNSQGMRADFQATTTTTTTTTTPSMKNLWPNGAASPSTSIFFDNSDVDTSLHL